MLMVISLAACNLKLYCNYVDRGREHEEEDRIKSWVCFQIVLIAFTSISFAIGIGISGIWGMVKATDVINFEKKFNMAPQASVPYAESNLPFAVMSFVLVLILAIVQIVLWCTCLSYTDTYGFTENTGYSRRHGYTRRYPYRPRPNFTSVSLNSESNSRHYLYTAEPGCVLPNDHGNTELRVNIQMHSEDRQVPSAPSRDIQDGAPYSSHLYGHEIGHRTLNENGSESLPPSYDHVVEELPPLIR